jgi:hypothetical protein
VAIANHHSVVSARATSWSTTMAATTTRTARMTEKELNRTRSRGSVAMGGGSMSEVPGGVGIARYSTDRAGTGS